MLRFSIVILLALIAGSCCSLCKVETTIEHQIDTVYVTDTVTITLVPQNVSNENDQMMVYLTDAIGARDSVMRILASIERRPYPNHHPFELSTEYIYVGIDTVYAETRYAESKAWVDSSILHLNLENKEKALAQIDSLESLILTTQVAITYAGRNAEATAKDLRKSKRLNWLLGGILLIAFLLVLGNMIRQVFKK